MPDATALARGCGVSQTKLNDLLRVQAHMTPAAWLKRERVRAACRRLLLTDERVVDVGFSAGFESESAFHRQFLASTKMTPGAYRGLNGASVFLLQLPEGYRAREVLAYHARDPASPCERVDGSRIFKALVTEDGSAILELSLEPQAAWCRVHADAKLGPHGIEAMHSAALRMLGLTLDVTPFETRAGRDPRMARVARASPRVALAAHADRLRRAVLGDHRSADQRCASRAR